MIDDERPPFEDADLAAADPELVQRRPPSPLTRTRMLTLARMFARFCFHVSPFAVLVLWTPVVLAVSRPC